MPPAKKLDTHIHLWPTTATTTKSHTWMTPGHFLAQRHGIDEYKTAISDKKAPPYGFIYVETDRALPSRFPDISNAATLEETQEKLRVWAAAPLEELKFLRRIVESAPTGDGSDGFQPADAGMMEGMVVYAPFHLPAVQFEVYLKMARATLGEAAWDKVVGHRYLLQGRGSGDVKILVQSADFLRNLRANEVRGRVFDVGVDSHRDGVEVLHSVGQLVGKVEGVKFVLNHLCKPDLSTPASFTAWSVALEAFTDKPYVYMKLSGAFNEFAPEPTPATVPALLELLKPYFDRVYEVFGSERIMFGSDWPVCNVGGPRRQIDEEGKQSNWGLWRDVVEAWMDERRLGENIKEDIWWRTGAEAYRIGEL